MPNITGHTELVGLMAYPIRHTQSPTTHNLAYDKNGDDVIQLAFEVDNDTLEAAVESIRALKMLGSNISMPNKTVVHKYLDEVDEAAKLCGAATAILVQAALDGVAEINVFNVKDAFYPRAEEIVKKLNERTGCKVTLHDYSDPEILRQSIADSAILVNGTSVGMAPKTDNTIITDTTMFHKDLFVFDVIYNPQETRLLREARAAGCKTSNGMYMLLYQGAASFELWTGQQMPVEIIKEKYFTK